MHKKELRSGDRHKSLARLEGAVPVSGHCIVETKLILRDSSRSLE
ncbi:hypothetical protein [Oceanispirochaeta sp.]|nr:hypothetical protein [Oceanispirochaeta sp.]MDA3955925.1 hypothetical protein [Oceanispirochaeta sp.]